MEAMPHETTMRTQRHMWPLVGEALQQWTSLEAFASFEYVHCRTELFFHEILLISLSYICLCLLLCFRLSFFYNVKSWIQSPPKRQL